MLNPCSNDFQYVSKWNAAKFNNCNSKILQSKYNTVTLLKNLNLLKTKAIKSLPDAVAMFMIERKSKTNEKIINDYFCVWTCLNSHGKL